MASTFALTSPGGRAGEDPLLTSRELTVAVVEGGRASLLEGCPTSQSATGMGPSGVP